MNPDTAPTDLTTDLIPRQPDMDLEPLEVFVTDMALIMAGTVTASSEAEAPSAELLGVTFFSAIAAMARKLPDYNPQTDIASVIQLGVAVYGEAVYATVAAAMEGFDLDSEDPAGE